MLRGPLLLLLAWLSSAQEAEERPWDAVAQIEPVLQRYRLQPPGSMPVRDSLQLLGLAENAFAAARAYDKLLLVRRELAELHAQHAAPGDRDGQQDLLLAQVALADALTKERRFDEAERVLKQTQRSILRGSAGSVGAIAGLWRARAEVRKCAGGGPVEHEAAVAAFVRGLPSPDWPRARLAGAAEVRLALDYLSLLRYAEFSGSGAAETAARVGAALVEAGPWRRVDQLPRSFDPHLVSQPWYDTAAPPWGLLPLVAALQAAAPALRAEFLAVAALEEASSDSGDRDGIGGPRLLLPETECIHDGGGPAVVAAGWRYFTVNAPWVQQADADGCALITPVACGLLRQARALGWGGSALRGTFSEIAGGARLRPHCGMTNAQVKLHLGLIVPNAASKRQVTNASADSHVTASEAVVIGSDGRGVPSEVGVEADEAGAPCASLTVAGESRPWTQGGVLMFDDSFEHSVVNVCPPQGPSKRVVFQLVLPHGDARRGAAAGAATLVGSH